MRHRFRPDLTRPLLVNVVYDFPEYAIVMHALMIEPLEHVILRQDNLRRRRTKGTYAG